MGELTESETAASYAAKFNGNIKFCMPVLARIVKVEPHTAYSVQKWLNQKVLLEPYLQGRYRKFVFLPQTPYHDVPQAFFHFTYQQSGGREVVWDLQGVHRD